MGQTKLPPSGADDVLYVVDVNSFIYRAYYAIGHLSNAKGQPTGAVLGVTRMLQKLWRERKPAYAAVAGDSETPTWRNETYSEYKANRPPPPPDLKEQIPVVHQMVAAYRIPVLKKNGFEADDVIATVARRARQAGLKTVVVTADKDLMQLVSDDLVVYDTMKDVVFGADEVEAKFGVPPDKLGDLLALMGDSSDNIPGVPSVGPKTAAKLIGKHGDLTSVLEAAPTIKGKMGEKLVANADQARLSRDLVALRDDMDIEFDLEKLRFGEPDLETLKDLLEELEFTQILEELGGGASEPEPQVERSYRTILTRPELDAAVAAIREAGEVSADLETTSLDPVQAEIVGIALSWKKYEGSYIPVGHRYIGMPDQLSLDEVLAALKPVLEDPEIKVYGQNFKYDDIVLRRHGLSVSHLAFDTMMASYLLDPGKRSHGLDALAKDELGYTTIKYNEITKKKKGSQLAFDEVEVSEATRYAAEDAEIVMTLVDKLAPKLAKAGFESLMSDIELPLGRVLADMEMTGVLVDTDQLKELSDSMGATLVELEERAHEAAGRSFNVNSPKQLAGILFDEIGLKPVKKTKGRTARSTDVEVLKELSSEHELPGIVLEYRSLAKLKGTYLDGLPKLVNPKTGRIHTSYNQAVAATGRLSSSDPNLQNIPVRTEEGRLIRGAFVAPPGHTLMAADYSQVELRVLAHLSDDPLLIDSFTKGEDVHARTARELFGPGLGLKPEDEVPSDLRRRAKAINFGVIYGKTEFSLAKELGISRTEAGAFIKDYFGRYAGVKSFMDQAIDEAKKGRGVKTLLGRRRFLPEINSKNYAARQGAERMARNTPIQGTAADIMKKAMILVHRRLKAEGLSSRMVLTVHDELVLEVPEGEEERAEALVVEEMMAAESLKVPLVVDVGWGKSWDQAH